MAGNRSLAAFWLGGAGVPPASTQGAVRGMFAFWMGGAGVDGDAPAPGNEGKNTGMLSMQTVRRSMRRYGRH